jgi:hypothetical protein
MNQETELRAITRDMSERRSLWNVPTALANDSNDFTLVVELAGDQRP